MIEEWFGDADRFRKFGHEPIYGFYGGRIRHRLRDTVLRLLERNGLRHVVSYPKSRAVAGSLQVIDCLRDGEITLRQWTSFVCDGEVTFVFRFVEDAIQFRLFWPE